MALCLKALAALTEDLSSLVSLSGNSQMHVPPGPGERRQEEGRKDMEIPPPGGS